MKSKISVDFVTSETVPAAKPTGRMESTPKIVVCPPMEDLARAGPVAAPRGSRLLRALSRHLSRRSATTEDSDSSSDSSEPRADDRTSCSVSDSGSDDSQRRRHRSTVSLRRVFQSLNLASRSHSCSPTERARAPKKQPQPKRILRAPVAYTYVRGLSGLPTQRVPRYTGTVCCQSAGLNR